MSLRFCATSGDRGVRTTAEAASYLHERITSRYASQGFGMWLVELAETGERVGICGLIKRDTLGDVDLGFSFLERYWRRGFAFEAATTVMNHAWKVAKLPRVAAIVAPHNLASIRLLEKLRFRFEKNVCLNRDNAALMLFVVEKTSKAANE